MFADTFGTGEDQAVRESVLPQFGAKPFDDFAVADELIEPSSIKPEQCQDVTVNSFNRPIGVDHLHPLVFGSEFEITVTHSVVELEIFGFEPSFIFRTPMVACPGAGETDFRLDIEKERHIRTVWLADKIGQFLNEIQRNAAAISLVGHRGMVITVADHHFARGRAPA